MLDAHYSEMVALHAAATYMQNQKLCDDHRKNLVAGMYSRVSKKSTIVDGSRKSRKYVDKSTIFIANDLEKKKEV